MAGENDKVEGVTSDPKDTMPAQAEQEKTPAVEDEIEDFPDPDEDDLDDLDGKRFCCQLGRKRRHRLTHCVEFLDDFSASKADPKAVAPQPSPSAAAEPSTAPTPPVPAPDDDVLDESLAKELEKGMADIFGGLDKSVRLRTPCPSSTGH